MDVVVLVTVFMLRIGVSQFQRMKIDRSEIFTIKITSNKEKNDPLLPHPLLTKVC